MEYFVREGGAFPALVPVALVVPPPGILPRLGYLGGVRVLVWRGRVVEDFPGEVLPPEEEVVVVGEGVVDYLGEYHSVEEEGFPKNLGLLKEYVIPIDIF